MGGDSSNPLLVHARVFIYQSHRGLKGPELEASVSLQRPSLAVGTKPDSMYWGRDLALSEGLRALTKQRLRLCDAPPCLSQ